MRHLYSYIAETAGWKGVDGSSYRYVFSENGNLLGQGRGKIDIHLSRPQTIEVKTSSNPITRLVDWWVKPAPPYIDPALLAR
jgi:hypothetical protein